MGTDTPKPLVIHAPNVHVGGGLVLLKNLMSSPTLTARLLFLDARTRDRLSTPAKTGVHYVKPSIIPRLSAEWRLRRIALKSDVVLCFHGLPPLFRLRSRVVVFIQNRILVNEQALSGYSTGVRIRLLLERWVLRAFSSHVDKIIVQTPSMARDVIRTLGKDVNISVQAFAAQLQSESQAFPQRFDFVCVAGDEPHKNHQVLLEAWRELAMSGLRPSLALTVPSGSPLAETIEKLGQAELPNITNLGVLSHRDISRLYGSASALIFPSYTESFGLPLIEAAQRGLPILAPELDYVRDVVDPVQTFDPHSAVSVARAVRRFLGQSDPTVELRSPDEFLSEVLR